MNLEWLATNLLAYLLLPPTGPLLLAVAGTLLLRRRPTLGRSLLLGGIATLWLLCTPIVAHTLLGLLPPPPQVQIKGNEADAIVILGGGLRHHAPEYGGPSLSSHSLNRAAYGAWLSRRTGKPILVTGGIPLGEVAEAQVMADTLEYQFGLKPAWVEARAINTLENARYSAELLRQAGIQRIYLVTSDWHLARAIPQFERQGLHVVPAGTGYDDQRPVHPLDFLPDARALLISKYFIHEAIGLVWYRLRNLIGV